MPRCSPVRLAALGTLCAALLVGCGGGDAPQDRATAFVAEIAQRGAGVTRERPAAVQPVSVDELLDWAEYQFPSLFPKGPQSFPLFYDGVNYTVRGYPNGNYLGVTPDGRIFGLGPFNGNVLTQYETIDFWSAQVVADRCKVYPGLCGGPVTGFNECIGPEWVTLPTGFRMALTFVDADDGSFEVSLDTVVDGPATFEGRSAVQSTTRGSSTAVEGSERSVVSTFESRVFEQNVAGGVPLTLGSLDVVTTPEIVIPGLPPFPGTTTRTRTSYDPPTQATEFTLQPGQSITRTERGTTVDLDGTQSPSSFAYTITYTYELRESITVAGKRFDTCRYRIADASEGAVTTVWYVVGKGVPVRSQTTAGGETSTEELRPPSSYGGQSLF